MRARNLILLFVLCLLGLGKAHAQTVTFNGNFKDINFATNLPVGWYHIMDELNYSYAVDSHVVKKSKYSLSITSKTNEGSFGAISCAIEQTFKGRKVQLKGFIKTENVVGYAGFWVRIDGTSAFNNMEDQHIHGTTDWKEYTIDLPYDQANATILNIGALLVGKGKMWISNVRFYVDGVPVEKAKIKQPETFAALKDTDFSKNSGIADFTPNNQQIKNLALLCQVWGFVKYHLPKSAKGDINMDAELFRVMPEIIKASNYNEASGVIEKWIDKLGLPPHCPNCSGIRDANIAQKPDYGEIFDKLIVSPQLADKLTYIIENSYNSKNYYIAKMGAGNPDFTHEISYDDVDYPDAGIRLLSLFRYWNMIQYFFPYKHLIGEDWNKVLPAYIPRFVNAKDAIDYDLAAMALISNVHDSHANIWSSPKGLSEYRGKYSPPFMAKFIENKLVVTDYYNDTLNVKNNIKVGDVIKSINGIKIDSLIRKYLPITAASNYETQLRDMPREYLLRSKEPDFKFVVERNGQTLQISQQGMAYGNLNVALLVNPHPNEPGFHLINNDIGYIFPGKYHNKDLPAIKDMFKTTKGIIVDMRCYPSEFMPFTFVPFIKTGDAKFVYFTSGSIFHPGLFSTGDPLNIKPENSYKGKVVVIVNEQTQSQAEYTTMAFQSSPNVTVIGSTTAGADGNVSQITLPGKITTMISGLGVLYPDGTETQRKGVKIDVKLNPTIEGIKAGKDEALEKAKAIIVGS